MPLRGGCRARGFRDTCLSSEVLFTATLQHVTVSIAPLRKLAAQRHGHSQDQRTNRRCGGLSPGQVSSSPALAGAP